MKTELSILPYPIVIGEKAIQELPKYLKGRRSKKIYLISDERLKIARKLTVQLLQKNGFEVHDIAVKAGEGLKDIQSVYPIYGELLKKKADRDSLIIALGGGSIGDTAGFIAATYLRGIEWIGLPTTLLAQVDSSVGGKTGINHATGKNLIGAFHQPSLVICDTQFLKTLSPREMISGIGEIAKYAFVYDAPFFSYLEKNLNALLAFKPKVLQECIQRSLRWKSKAVLNDIQDRKGVREVLNFGHTFGHALESATHYEKFQHGEAVIWGMRFALALSQQRKHLSVTERKRLDSLLQRLPLPAIPKNLTRDGILQYMKKDKKSEGDRIRFVLLSRLGKSISDRDVTREDLNAAYALLTQKEPRRGN